MVQLKFQGHAFPLVGIGTEVLLIDEKDGFPRHENSQIVEKISSPRLKKGVFQSVIEIDSQLHSNVDEAISEMENLLNKIREVAHGMGITLMSGGTHPTAPWDIFRITPTPLRQKLLDRLAWVGKRMVIFGLRLYVGVPNGEMAIAVSGALRNLIPLFVALSASSPFWNGYDTGLASVRSRIIENVPNAGIPPKFVNWAEFASFVRILRASEAIQDFSEIWWDIRPSLASGTVRIQVCDAPHTLREMAILASLAHSAVHTLLEYYKEGRIILEQSHIMIRENKWRASRFGMEGKMIISFEGDVIPLRKFLEMTLERILPSAKVLGCDMQLQEIDEILAYGPGYVRQRMMRQEVGMDHIPLAMAYEFESDKFFSQREVK